MSDWNDRPPEQGTFAGIRLTRVPPNKVWRGLITSETLVGRFTHFVFRRTEPHVQVDCPHCLKGLPARWHGYVSMCGLSFTNHAVIELTALAAKPVIEYQDRKGTLRGAQIELQRLGNAINSPVSAALRATDVDLRNLPQPVEIRQFLEHIWGLTSDENRQNEPSPEQQLTAELAKRNALPPPAKQNGRFPKAVTFDPDANDGP